MKLILCLSLVLVVSSAQATTCFLEAIERVRTHGRKLGERTIVQSVKVECNGQSQIFSAYSLSNAIYKVESAYAVKLKQQCTSYRSYSSSNFEETTYTCFLQD